MHAIVPTYWDNHNTYQVSCVWFLFYHDSTWIDLIHTDQQSDSFMIVPSMSYILVSRVMDGIICASVLRNSSLHGGVLVWLMM